MSYRIRAVDANQPAIVKALRAAGAFVLHLHTLGHGAPDLLVVWKGLIFLIEVKVDKEELNKDEKALHAIFPYPIDVVRSPTIGLALIESLTPGLFREIAP